MIDFKVFEVDFELVLWGDMGIGSVCGIEFWEFVDFKLFSGSFYSFWFNINAKSGNIELLIIFLKNSAGLSASLEIFLGLKLLTASDGSVLDMDKTFKAVKLI